MVPDLRKAYNKDFLEEKYSAFEFELYTAQRFPLDFRVSETPLFLTKELSGLLEKASYEILDQVTTPEYLKISKQAIPSDFRVPGEDEHPLFVQIDFAICKDEAGNFTPRLIELQGFPSLYCYEVFLDDVWRKHFNIPANLTPYFSGLNRKTYIEHLREAIVGNLNPENVILLEIDPEKQKTRIDFACTEDLLGVPTVNLTDLIIRGKNVYYMDEDREIPVRRIYNRVIFDELAKKKVVSEFDFRKEYNLTWAGHPQWFHRISKFSLPYIKSEYCPPCQFLDQIDKYPRDLKNYVLKPLYSFAGYGVEINVTPGMLDGITDRKNYMLQRKVDYAPLVETPDGYSRCEIRMMFLWNDKPMLVNNLVRMSKGPMMGVAYNTDKTWIGSSLAYHPV